LWEWVPAIPNQRQYSSMPMSSLQDLNGDYFPDMVTAVADTVDVPNQYIWEVYMNNGCEFIPSKNIPGKKVIACDEVLSRTPFVVHRYGGRWGESFVTGKAGLLQTLLDRCSAEFGVDIRTLRHKKSGALVKDAEHIQKDDVLVALTAEDETSLKVTTHPILTGMDPLSPECPSTCQYNGAQPPPSCFSCRLALSGNPLFKAVYYSPPMDAGYGFPLGGVPVGETRWWVDVNGDDQADFCVYAGSALVNQATIACYISAASSYNIDPLSLRL